MKYIHMMVHKCYQCYHEELKLYIKVAADGHSLILLRYTSMFTPSGSTAVVLTTRTPSSYLSEMVLE